MDYAVVLFIDAKRLGLLLCDLHFLIIVLRQTSVQMNLSITLIFVLLTELYSLCSDKIHHNVSVVHSLGKLLAADPS